MDEHGTLITNVNQVSALYEGQINSLIEKQNILARSIVEQEIELAKHKGTVKEDTEEYREMQANLVSLQNQFNETTVSLDELQDKMR